jgi:preprotein translocase subunit SecF
MSARGGAFGRLFRGETAFDFAGRWRRWFAISGIVILVGLASLGVRGLNFSVDFKGGTIWQVPTTASVATVRNAIEKQDSSSLSNAVITQITNTESHKVNIQVQAGAKDTANDNLILSVRSTLAAVAHTSTNNVTVDGVGASWGSDISHKAVKAVIIFLIAVSVYIWLRFEGKMAIAALVALVHDILVTVGIYSLSGFQVSPDTVIAFLTILGYSLYDTIVVFDKVQENTRSVASSNRYTYSDYVNLSMNQVLARSLNTSFVAIIPILSILVIGAGLLGATTLDDFGLALFIGLTTGAYSSIFIASPLLAILKEREPRYAEIRRRLSATPARRLTPAAAAAAGGIVPDTGGGAGRPVPRPRRSAVRSAPVRRGTATTIAPDPTGPDPDAAVVADRSTDADLGAGNGGATNGGATNGGATNGGATNGGATNGGATNGGATNGGGGSATAVPPRASGQRPPPRPRKKRRR